MFQGNTASDINILDLERERWVYCAPAQDLDAKLKEMEQYREYLFLYFFGIGNGLLFGALLQNEKHKQIIVVEPDIELIYIALHFVDFSEALASKRLVVTTQEYFTFQKVVEALHSSTRNSISRFSRFTAHRSTT